MPRCSMVRLRTMDCQRLADEPRIDGDWCEAIASGIKTARGVRKERIRLVWLELRCEYGLHVKSQGCVMPAPVLDSGGWICFGRTVTNIVSYAGKQERV